jgi:hypothetical protein
VPPERSAEFAHLTIGALRVYRQALSDEENRVSYWRRILQARLDLVRAGDSTAGDLEQLRPVVTGRNATVGRTNLVRVLPVDDIPPLPDLGLLWETLPDEDPVSRTRLERALMSAERELSDYRNALHRRIGAATTELIARYRQDPLLCLSSLPHSGG